MPDLASAYYPPPLDRLLRLGKEPARRRLWPDYRLLGLEPRHVPALARMAADPALHTAEERAPEVWAPVHAWRALAQLEAAAAPAVEPLLAVLEREADNPWVFDEIPSVLGMIGAPALPGATLLLFDDTRSPHLRIAGSRVIAEVAQQYPERRDEAVAVLAKQLEEWHGQDAVLNASLIADLVELGATDAAPVMEAAYAAGAVDLSIYGDWEDVQVELGLLEERLTPPAPGSYFDEHAAHAPQPARRPRADAPDAARTRRKAAKQSRKRNRKKK
ncbi:MAG TPA: hypothetical protein VFQ39_08525 [Longimicrobium sp.]|nr:hypothetical protein [Longimicrobium sp.]